MKIDNNALIEKYNSSSEEEKKILVDLLGEDVFKVDIRDKVKTYKCAKDVLETRGEMIKIELVGKQTSHNAYMLIQLWAAFTISSALNEGWEPNWGNSDESKYSVYYNNRFGKFSVSDDKICNFGCIYFKSEVLAEYFISQFFMLCNALYRNQ